MELLNPTSFASAVANSKESLKKVSIIISKYCGKVKSNSFLNACDKLDFLTANTILNETFKELTGYDSVFIALRAFSNKFSQMIPNLESDVAAALSESDEIKIIDSYREQIIDILNRKC